MIDLNDLAKRAGGVFNGRDALIPGPGHSKADRSLSVSIGDNCKLIWCSFAGDGDNAVRAYLNELGAVVDAVDPRASQTMPARRRRGATGGADLAALLWAESCPIDDTLAARYLSGRAIEAPFPTSLRFHLACPDGPFRRPALIAARTLLDAPSRVLSIQRTYLRQSGAGKADIASAKKSLGSCKGGGVALGDIGAAILVAEGVETALSAAALFGLPAVATLGVVHTRALIIPHGVRSVVVAADNDDAGGAAAEALAARLRKEGRCVRIESPPPAFKDFNDLATGKERSVGAPRSFRGGGPLHGV